MGSVSACTYPLLSTRGSTSYQTLKVQTFWNLTEPCDFEAILQLDDICDLGSGRRDGTFSILRSSIPLMLSSSIYIPLATIENNFHIVSLRKAWCLPSESSVQVRKECTHIQHINAAAYVHIHIHESAHTHTHTPHTQNTVFYLFLLPHVIGFRETFRKLLNIKK